MAKYCCEMFHEAFEDGYIDENEKGKYQIISGASADDYYYVEIKYCPFCGKKLEIKNA